jgi:hypothetical protein
MLGLSYVKVSIVFKLYNVMLRAAFSIVILAEMLGLSYVNVSIVFKLSNVMLRVAFL